MAKMYSPFVRKENVLADGFGIGVGGQVNQFR